MKLAQQAEDLELPYFEKRDTGEALRKPTCISAYRFAGLLLLTDTGILITSGALPALAYDGINTAAIAQHLVVVSVTPPFFLLTFQALNVYGTEHIFDLRQILLRSLASLLLTFSGLMVIAIATKTSGGYSRAWFFSWIVLSLVLSTSVRAILIAVVEAKLTRGACLQRALIVTYGENALSGDQLALETRNRVRAVGAISLRNLESAPDISPYIKNLRPEIVIISLPWSHVEAAMTNIKALAHHAVEVLVLPQTSPGLQKALRLRRVGGQTLLQFGEPPLLGWDRVVKRIEDVTVASIALFLISPVLIVTAIAIKLESKGPVLFKQVREGFNGELIEVWKFRSMFLEATDHHAACQTRKDDPRVTRVGRFIRKTSIDELPQFWNVLQGQMSIVGPRPHALGTSAEGKALNVIVENYATRHRVKPGITGWAQINGARGELRSQEQVKRRLDYDLHYIENWSLLFDVKIILMTAIRVFYDPRAY